MKEKKWKKALGLTILLNKPYRCYEIIKDILQQEETNRGRNDLEKTLITMREDQISKN